jgi:hypothetical protein
VLNSTVWTGQKTHLHAEGKTHNARSFKEVSTETSMMGNSECRHRIHESSGLSRKESNRDIYRRQAQSRQDSVASFVGTNCYYSNGDLIGSPSSIVITWRGGGNTRNQPQHPSLSWCINVRICRCFQ